MESPKKFMSFEKLPVYQYELGITQSSRQLFLKMKMDEIENKDFESVYLVYKDSKLVRFMVTILFPLPRGSAYRLHIMVFKSHSILSQFL